MAKTYILRLFIPYNWHEPTVGPFLSLVEARTEVERIREEGLWEDDIFYFPGWIKRIEIEEKE